jgi:hypothetical protein
VPTHLDVEDRPFCGLTVRQVLVLAVGGAWAYAAWNGAPALPVALRVALAGACLLLAAGASLGWGTRGLLVLRYAAGPRVAVWRATAPEERDGAHRRPGAGGPGCAWVAWEPVAGWAHRPTASSRPAGPGGTARGRARVAGATGLTEEPVP